MILAEQTLDHNLQSGDRHYQSPLKAPGHGQLRFPASNQLSTLHRVGDIHPAIQHTGMTYEERGRGIFGLNGTNVALDPEGERWKLSEHEPVKVDTAEWTEYTIIARGNHLIHQVNGETTSELFDYHEEGRALEGLIAIQLHRGYPNRVEIKEIEMRELKDGNILPFELPEGAEKIDRPRTSNPQGTGPIQKGKKG